MQRFQMLIFLLFFALFIPQLAQSQSTFMPSPDETPFSDKAQGFVTSHLGFAYLPILSIEGEHSGSETNLTKIWDEATAIPGFTAAIGIAPSFQRHAWILEASYTMFAANFKMEVETYDKYNTGDTVLSINTVNIATGYGYFFLEGPWYIYPFITGAVAAQSVRANVNYDDEETETSSDKFSNIMGTAGFGFFHRVSTGGIGGEFRVDVPILTSEFSFKDPYGTMDIDVYSPVMFRLSAIFLLGRL